MTAVTSTILSEGQTMDPTFRLLSLECQREVNRIPWAELRLVDGDISRKVFDISDSGFFALGNTVEIKLRYEGSNDKDQTVFKGLVVRQTVEASSQGSVLVVGLKDAAIRLTGPRRSRIFHNKTDQQAIAELISEAQLKAGDMPTTEPIHPELVQYNSSDWDFMLSRADSQGLLTLVSDGQIDFHSPSDLFSAPSEVLEWGNNSILDFDLQAGAEHPLAEVRGSAWNIEKQALTTSLVSDWTPPPNNLDPEAIQKKLGFPPRQLVHTVPLANEEVVSWAGASLSRSRLALLRGRISVPGTGALGVLQIKKILGIGKVWNGDALITGLSHRVDSQGWRTDIQLGLKPESCSEQHRILQPPAGGLLPAIQGPQIGIVAAPEDDPLHQHRIKVLLPAIDTEGATVWARMAYPDAGAGRGIFHRPTEGDEVILGFLNNDPRHPVILGSLYSSTNTPPACLADPPVDDKVRGRVTPQGTSLTFTDTKKAGVELKTAQGNRLSISDDDQHLELADQHGNSIRLSAEGVVIKSAKDLKIEATGGVVIQGQKVDVL